MSDDDFAITDAPIDAAAIARRVRHAGAGAVVVFEGAVRDVNDGRPVTRLEYSAYESMAHKEMRAIAREVMDEIPDTRAAAAHRVGALDVGDVAVVVAVSAPHRDEAFRAARALIDRIKERVPIWKREHGPDGAYWVGWADARCTSDGRAHAAHDTHAHAPGADRHEGER